MTIITRNTIRQASDFLFNHLLKTGCIHSAFDNAESMSSAIGSGCSNKAFQSELKFRKLSEEEFDRQKAKLILLGEVRRELLTESVETIDTYSSRLLINERIKVNGEESVILSLSIEDMFTAEEWQELTNLSDEELFKKLHKTSVIDRCSFSRTEIPKRYTVEILTRGNSEIILSDNLLFNATVFTHIYISGLKCVSRRRDNTGFITNNYMLKEINLTNLDISNIKSFDNFFKDNLSLRKIIGLETLKVAHIVSADNMFYCCGSLEELNTTGWRFPKLKRLSYAFYCCKSLKRIIGLNEWNPRSLEYMDYTFADIQNIEEIDLSNWKPVHLKSMVASFLKCTTSKIALPDLSHVTEHCVLNNTTSMFKRCTVESIVNLNTMNFDNYKKNKMYFSYNSMFASSDIKDKNFMHGFDIMKVFKFEDSTKGIAELTSSVLLSKELDVTYWRKFMTDPEIEEAANKIGYSIAKKNDEEFILARLKEWT